MQSDLSRVTTWLFDLDNTLYSPNSAIFPQMHARMSGFMVERMGFTLAQAEQRRADYFHTYGTTMRGLMVEHAVEPHDFMDYVHDVDLSDVQASTRLDAALSKIKSRKIIFTNASRRHAVRILQHLNISHHFPDIFDIQDGGYECKPHEGPYKTLLQNHSLSAANCCMVDDMEANLNTAARLGMRTLWLRHEADWQRHKPKSAEHYPHCHYTTDDLIPFLEELTL